MSTKITGSILAVCLMTFYACGETRTWTGGGANANWSTPGNWGGTAPAMNDTLVFSGTTRLASTNDLSTDIPFAGIVFKSGAGAFTLSGNRLTLDGSVSNLSTSAQTLSLDMVLPDTRAVDSSTGAITINGSLSGMGGLTKTGPQALKLTASNSYDGVTTVNNGMLAITHDNALGSTNGNTVVDSNDATNLRPDGGYLQISGNITVPEPLYLNRYRTGAKSTLEVSSGSNTLSGPVACLGIRIHLAAETVLTLTGGLKNEAGYLVLNNPASSTIAFYDNPINSPFSRFYLNNTGLIIIGVPGNVWTPTEILTAATLRTDVADALPPGSPLIMTGDAAATLDLNGFNQTVSEIFHLSTGIIRSAIPATLIVNQTSTTTFRGKLTGAVNLLKAGTGTLILSNVTSTTTGDITVTNGTLAVALDNSLGNSTNVTVLGGTLDLRVPDGIADTASLSIYNDNGATVNIKEGISDRVGQLFLNGVQQTSGTWGTTASGAGHQDNTYFSGKGVIYVQKSPPIVANDVIWDGDGIDTLLNTAANWLEDTVPIFGGTTHAIFGTGGSTATVNTAASLYGITFNRTGDFTLADGDGTLTLGGGGITAESPDTTSRTYELSEALTLTDNSTWHVATNGSRKTNLNISGVISDSSDAFGFTKTGGGNLTLSGNNTYNGKTLVKDGNLTITHPHALGSTNGITELDCMAGGYLNLSGGFDVTEPLLINGQRPGAQPSISNLGGSNTLSGAVMLKSSGVGLRIAVALDSELIFRGGVTGNCGGGWHIFTTTGKLAFYDNPVVLTPGIIVFFEVLGQGVVLGVSGNVWGITRIGASGILRMGAANALPDVATLEIQHNGAIVDLDGFDQSVRDIVNLSKGVITSAMPATLTVNQRNNNATYSGHLTGAVGLLKTGAKTLTLSNSLNNTTGEITVNNGILAAASENSLGNSTNITVTGSAARLELQTSSTIVDTATLTIVDNGAMVNLAAGVNETIGWLYLGKTMQGAGTYGSTTSAAVHKDKAFLGTGILKVLHDKSGTLISLR